MNGADMMGYGWMGGGYGGIVIQVLAVVVLIAFVAWLVKQKIK